jgi:hypothetical protein
MRKCGLLDYKHRATENLRGQSRTIPLSDRRTNSLLNEQQKGGQNEEYFNNSSSSMVIGIDDSVRGKDPDSTGNE